MQHFEHHLIWKYCVVFGSFFNDIVIQRGDKNTPDIQKFKVPIEFAPREKFLAMTSAKPDHKQRAITLPVLSYELEGMSFDSSRKIDRRKLISADNKRTLRGAPWNFNFKLYLLTKNMLDATKIAEQILFMFQPDHTVDVKLIDGFDHLERITTDFNGVTHQDEYEGDFTRMRRTMWTFDFTMRGWIFGHIDESGKRIKRIDLDFHPQDGDKGLYSDIMIIPGLTADGRPTTDINETIPYLDINKDDDYGIISVKEEGIKYD